MATSTVFAFDEFHERAERDEGPGHVLEGLIDSLGAQLHQPEGPVSTVDRLSARVVGTPEHWALARSLLAEATERDLVYASGDDVGLAIALSAVIRRRRPKLAIFYTAPRRLRARTLTAMVSRLGLDILPVAGSPDKVEVLDELLGRRPAVLAPEQTDTNFFRPPQQPATVTESLVVSCGLEQRDYRTLAKAVEDGPYDVKICAVSPNFTAKTSVAMPETVPERMEIRHFDFDELRTLYQQAAVTVVPLLANEYSAGTTTMIEAIACGSPVVISRNPGLAEIFADQDLVIGVPPGDDGSLRRAIDHVLSNQEESRERAQRARAYVIEHHSDTRYVQRLVAVLRSFSEGMQAR